MNYKEMIRRDKLNRLRAKSSPPAPHKDAKTELGRGDKPVRNGVRIPYLCVICGDNIEDQLSDTMRGAVNQACDDCSHRIQYIANGMIDKADKELRKRTECRYMTAPLRDGSRIRVVAAARGLIVVELREKHDATWSMIAKALGYRNHSSAIHAYKKAKDAEKREAS